MLKFFACLPAALLLALAPVSYGQGNRQKAAKSQADCRVESRSQTQASLSCSIERPEPTLQDRTTSRDVEPLPVAEQRLGQYSSWDGRCRSRGAPRVRVVTAPRLGTLDVRSESAVVGKVKFGTDCSGTVQSGSAVYYRPLASTDPSSSADFVEVEVHYWDHAAPHRFRYRYSINVR